MRKHYFWLFDFISLIFLLFTYNVSNDTRKHNDMMSDLPTFTQFTFCRHRSLFKIDFKVNIYTLRGSNSALFMIVSLLGEGQLLIRSSWIKHSFLSEPFGKFGIQESKQEVTKVFFL